MGKWLSLSLAETLSERNRRLQRRRAVVCEELRQIYATGNAAMADEREDQPGVAAEEGSEASPHAVNSDRKPDTYYHQAGPLEGPNLLAELGVQGILELPKLFLATSATFSARRKTKTHPRT